MAEAKPPPPPPPPPNPSSPSSHPQTLIVLDRSSSFQQQPPPLPPPTPAEEKRRFGVFPLRRRPPIRVTSEFDSDSSVYFHKVSSKFFNGLAKLKLSFQNNSKGDIADPQISFITKNIAVQYDVEDKNALVSGSYTVAPNFQLRAFHDVKTNKTQIPLPNLELAAKYFSICCLMKEQGILLKAFVDFPSRLRLTGVHDIQAQQGEVAIKTHLTDPGYTFELASAVPSIGLPKATLVFPAGQVSFEEKEDEEENRILSVSSLVKAPLMNGVFTALYKDDTLNMKYRYKDDEMSFIPSIDLPSNALSFAFKRRFGPSDKLSYWYNFDTNYWSTVYKHTVRKEYKFKAGYDSEVRLGWASLWVGDENGKTKTAPLKTKIQFMLQVPQDDIKGSTLLFRVKKRWDI